MSRHPSQEVRPWNAKFARAVTEPAFMPRPESTTVTLDAWATTDDAEWTRPPAGTALRQAERDGFCRNAQTARANLDRRCAAP